ncbi:elks delta-like protein [Strigomonas culicis]|nr:elks delta-like protein [Strigomonas culicis]|eukprot:EPY29574.1 elks delta-like protein [Strigomonas culicis]
MRESSVDAQKRLTVVRLMSMLDDLQNSLNEKISGPQGDEEARTQELLKIIQELTRSREQTLMLMSKKEREFQAIIQLKKKRVAELQSEASRNMNNLSQVNDSEILSVAQRIQRERRALMNELDKQAAANDRLADVMRDTKYAVDCSTKDRKAVLSADEALGNSKDPEQEMLDLQERIANANLEKMKLIKKTEDIKRRTEVEADRYNEKMSQLKKEILVYQGECSRLETENKELKSLCDSMAVSLQS